MKLTCSLASLALAAAAVPTAACAQHLWYNDRGPGDLMLLDVNVQASALTTYFETLGWNQGGDA
ncbi:MAG: hypothetical protein JWP52_3753, partial [Rhizobacter sp.]|nr:hypothetical protein [Rhizobacter sp.]